MIRQGVATGHGGALGFTDIYGEQLTVDGIAVQPYAAQPTRVPFAAIGRPVGRPSPARKRARPLVGPELAAVRLRPRCC
ncbi:hypothetical protein [Streptomyces sviceus]|uniref:hypothetical protein n=1 Tax=Streptomyces sviceus TaxID=285530 RepID=UPI003333F445